MIDLPGHCKTAIRDWIRLGVWGVLVGMILGIWWTGVRKQVRYAAPGQESALIQLADPPYVQLPPGMHWEAGVKLKLSHGHVILIAGCLPFCFAAGIFLIPACGGRDLSPGLLKAGFWTYTLGAIGAVTIMVYRGQSSFAAVQRGEFDFAAAQDALFNGSRALKGASYGITHTLLAIGVGIVLHQLWRGASGITGDSAPGAESLDDQENPSHTPPKAEDPEAAAPPADDAPEATA